MAEFCPECAVRGKYLKFADLALTLDEELRADYGRDVLPPGGLLFLGKHYAHSRTILFTLNPTPHAGHLPQSPVETQLFKTGIHWDGPAEGRYRNWTGGRLLFHAMLDAAPWFRTELDIATDAFIVPWASRDWKIMTRSAGWPSIKAGARALFQQNMIDHHPTVVFTTGKFANNLFWSFSGTSRPTPVDVWRSPTNRNWDAEHFVLENFTVGEDRLPRLDLFRLPHFSRFSREQFGAIGEWVAGRLPHPSA